MREATAFPQSMPNSTITAETVAVEVMAKAATIAAAEAITIAGDAEATAREATAAAAEADTATETAIPGTIPQVTVFRQLPRAITKEVLPTVKLISAVTNKQIQIRKTASVEEKFFDRSRFYLFHVKHYI